MDEEGHSHSHSHSHGEGEGEEQADVAEGYRMLVSMTDAGKGQVMQFGCFIANSLKVHRVTLYPADSAPTPDQVFGGFDELPAYSGACAAVACLRSRLRVPALRLRRVLACQTRRALAPQARTSRSWTIACRTRSTTTWATRA